MNYILRAKNQFHRAIHRQNKRGALNVILGGWISRAIKTKVIPDACVYLVYMNRAELAIRPGITKVKRELLSQCLNSYDIPRRQRPVHTRPSVPTKRGSTEEFDSDEQRTYDDCRGYSETPLSRSRQDCRVNRRGCSTLECGRPQAESPHKTRKQKLRDDEDNRAVDESPMELRIKLSGMLRGGRRKPPDTRSKERRGSNGDRSKQQRENFSGGKAHASGYDARVRDATFS
jgi:hypothetical protein